MIIGVPKEIKNGEKRVSLIPSSVKELVKNGHTVYVEKNAGSAIGFEDSLYEAVGAKILDNSAEIYAKSEIIVKVKEPQTGEFALFKTGQTIITYFHLAVEPELLEVLIKKKITAIAYETIELPDGSLPLLRPDERNCRKNVRTNRRTVPANRRKQLRHFTRRRCGRNAGRSDCCRSRCGRAECSESCFGHGSACYFA